MIKNVHRRSRKVPMNIKQTVCAFLVLGVQHAMRTRHIVICGLPRSTKYFHFIS